MFVGWVRKQWRLEAQVFYSLGLYRSYYVPDPKSTSWREMERMEGTQSPIPEGFLVYLRTLDIHCETGVTKGSLMEQVTYITNRVLC